MRVLLFNPPSALSVYSKTKIRAVVPKLPSMSLAMIAGSLLQEDIDTKISDLMLYEAGEAKSVVRREISEFKPDIVGVTATTALFYEASQISDEAKAVSKNIITVLGGPHASSLPPESLAESSFDAVVAGEGERPIKEVVKTGRMRGAKKIFHMSPIENLDNAPFPMLELFNSGDYICSKIIARNNPVGPIEISRGCVFNCSFCNKTVHGRRFRIKTPKRVVEELFILKRLGYREFHVLDDQFTTNISKAKGICEEIIRSRVGMSWNLRTGVRVDTIDKEFLSIAKRAGCYQVGVGFESGSQERLDAVNKGIRLKDAIGAVDMIRKSGIEVAGFFILGLPGETIESMEETIRFAIRLKLDYAKATILVPFPGTDIYDEFDRKGLIKTKDWSRYNFHNADEIYIHPTLNWKSLKKYYELFHRRFYFRPGYLIKRGLSSIVQGRLFTDLYHGYKTFKKN